MKDITLDTNTALSIPTLLVVYRMHLIRLFVVMYMRDYHCPKWVKNKKRISNKMNNPLREFVLDRLSTLLEIPSDDTICVNLETRILNHSMTRALETSQVPAWDNHKYTNIYKHKFLSIQKCIKENPTLKERLTDKTIKTEDFFNMRPEQMLPDGPYAKELDQKIHKDMRKEYFKREIQQQDGFFKCGRCKSMKTTYFQMQNR
jgi:DNA-directed RNA polymerase subunit M/transcription elongation factor TFIIS